MGTVISFKPATVAELPMRQEPDKTAATIKEILTYLLGQAEAAGTLPMTAHALALAIHCAGKEVGGAD